MKNNAAHRGRPEPGTTVAIVAPGTTFHSVTEQISTIVTSPDVPPIWFWSFAVALTVVLIFLTGVVALISTGVGIFGNNIPVAWAFPITNFVWWIGIGHAGTLISAILLLLNQPWRNSINRFAEAMTLFAVACAGLFPVFHLGRPWVAFWILPYPNLMTVQSQFRSPLVWDVFAVSTYATVSLLFWYLGMIPDLASVRDRATGRLEHAVYGVLALGWRGASQHWRWHKTASKLLAGLATPLVLSVHTVVSFDFTIAILAGWHSTIFPPYFVAGAIFSGFAMVLVLAIPIRKAYRLENLVTERHLENCAKLMLATGLVLAYTYLIEPFTSWYSGDKFEMAVVHNRAAGPYAWSFWAVIALQRGDSPIVVVETQPYTAADSVSHLSGCAGGNVAGALYDHRFQPAIAITCRLPGSDIPQPRGTTSSSMARSVCSPLLFLLFRALLPHDFDVGSARVVALFQAGRRIGEIDGGSPYLRHGGGVRRSRGTGRRSPRGAREGLPSL